MLMITLDYGNGVLVGLPAYLHDAPTSVGPETGDRMHLSVSIGCELAGSTKSRPYGVQTCCSDAQSFARSCTITMVRSTVSVIYLMVDEHFGPPAPTVL